MAFSTLPEKLVLLMAVRFWAQSPSFVPWLILPPFAAASVACVPVVEPRGSFSSVASLSYGSACVPAAASRCWLVALLCVRFASWLLPCSQPVAGQNVRKKTTSTKIREFWLCELTVKSTIKRGVRALPSSLTNSP